VVQKKQFQNTDPYKYLNCEVQAEALGIQAVKTLSSHTSFLVAEPLLLQLYIAHILRMDLVMAKRERAIVSISIDNT
jgi:hypothetical protein